MFEARYMKNAFGQADEDTKNRVRSTLSRLNAAEAVKSRHMRGFRIKAAVAVIAACFIVPTAVFAITHNRGVLDFIGGFLNSSPVLPGAVDIVQSDLTPEAAQTDLAAFAVRDAVFDGSDIYLTVAVTPKSKDIMVVPSYQFSGDPVADLGAQFEGRTDTIAEYAAAIGKTLAFAGFRWEFVNGSSWSSHIDGDGTLVIMVQSAYTGTDADALNMSLACILYTKQEINEVHPTAATLAFMLKNTGAFEHAASDGAVEFASAGVRVDSVTLTASEMSVNARVEYTVIDADKFAAAEGGLWFEFLESTSESLTGGVNDRLPDGPGGGQVIALDEAGTRFAQDWSLGAMETLPNSLTVRGYNSWDKSRYETHTVRIVKPIQ
jgi:hypothetical protein